MSVIHDLIIVEDVFEKIFSYLPSMKFDENDVDAISFKPIFSYGDEKELIAFLKSTEGEDKTPYPLIWLVYPYVESHLKTKVELKSVKLILAVDNKIVSQLNKERIDLNYKKILIPLCSNVVKILTKSNVLNTEHNFKLTKFPKYSYNEKNAATDVWDAIQIVFNTTIIDNCIKPIKI